jgi:multimeric flavodoxin WrbA
MQEKNTPKVKILGINASPRHATTEWGVKLALQAAESLGYVETDYVCLGDYDLKPCTGCMKCFGWQHPAEEGLQCYEWKDDTGILLQKMVEMDGLIFGTPVYTLGVTSLARILMEKAHMFGPMSFTRAARWLAYKPCGAITVGGVAIAGQESCALSIWHWATGLAMLPVGSWPTVDDPNPQNSEHGGMVSTVDARTIYGKNALSREACRTVPPTQGIRNERCLRNVGRQVAVTAMVTKLGRQTFYERSLKEPNFQSFVKYSVRPKPGSWIDKLTKEGKVIYAGKGKEDEEYEEPERLSAKK